MGTFNDPPPTPPDEHRMLDKNKMIHPYAIEESSIFTLTTVFQKNRYRYIVTLLNFKQ